MPARLRADAALPPDAACRLFCRAEAFRCLYAPPLLSAADASLKPELMPIYYAFFAMSCTPPLSLIFSLRQPG